MTQASFARPGVIAGTLAYMAPEQLRGGPADARSDVWALGAILSEISSKVGGVSAGFGVVVSRCLEQDPARRYANARELSDALGALDASASGTRRAARRRVTALAAAGAAVVIGSAILNVGGVRTRLMRAGRSPASVKLAVLPFENLTGDETQEYFSDGLTEEMIAQLGHLQPDRLGVIARTSAMRYKKTTKRLEEIGQELGIEYVLEGAARREGSRVRISAQLIRVRDETQLWSDTFDREVAGILAVESDVARAVARSLTLTLLPANQNAVAREQQINPDAYEAYLRGREHAYRLNGGDLDAARSYFEQALTKDPAYARAYAGIAQVWVSRQQMGFAQPRDAMPPARSAAERALALDPTLAEAHAQFAAIKTFSDWDWLAGGREYEKALELDPNDVTARMGYSHYLHIMKRPDEATSQIARAAELDPLNPMVRAFYGTGLLFLHRWDDAIAQYTIALRVAPNHSLALGGLANALHHAGKLQESLAMDRLVRTARGDLELVAALDRGITSAGYAGAMHEAGDLFAARSRASGTAPIGVSGYYLKAGDREAALEWIARSFEARDPNIPYAGVHPNYDLVRRDPRFRDLIRRLGLPD